MLKIHHLGLSRSDRIVWLAEELGLPYEVVRHQRDPQTFRAPDSLRRITRLAKAPALQDGDQTVLESAVICDYILDRYGEGRLRPAEGTRERIDYAYWMHCSESTLMYPVLMDLLMGMTQAEAPGLLGFVMGEYQTMFGHVEHTLADRDHLLPMGFSAADVMVYYTLAMASGTAIPAMKSRAPMTGFPRIRAYLARLEGRPAFQKAQTVCA